MIELILDNNNINSNKQLWEDTCLNTLADIFVKEDNLILLDFLRDLFYVKDLEDFNIKSSAGRILYEDKINEINIIIECFEKWNESIINNDLGNHRGIFLELLTYKHLKQVYPLNSIHHEVKFKTENFTSYTPDFIIELNKLFKIYECKSSSFSINSKTLFNLINIKENIQKSEINIVTLDYADRIRYKIKDLEQEIESDKNNITMTFNIIALEDLKEKNPIK